jgi:hypothetical protein
MCLNAGALSTQQENTKKYKTFTAKLKKQALFGKLTNNIRLMSKLIS